MSREHVARNLAFGLFACGLAAGCGSDDFDGGEEAVSAAHLRMQARYAWYHDEPTFHPRASLFSADYLRFIDETMVRERAVWNSGIGDGAQVVKSGAPSTQAVSGSTWVNIGPTTSAIEKEGATTLPGVSSGRVTAIVPHPTNTSTLYVAFAGGGVWKTTDGGTNWSAITESLGSLSVGSLAMDPNNANVLYLGFGDAFDGTGVGLVKSTDGGNTWSSPVYLGNSSRISQVIVAPTNSNIVLAGTNQGCYRSTDAGATWSLVPISTGQSENPYVWSIAWTGGSGYALTLEASPSATSGTTNGQAYRSTDAGASWSLASGFVASTGIGRSMLAAAPSNRSILYASAAIPNSSSTSDLADVFKSTNGGQTWVSLDARSRNYSNKPTESVSALFNGQGWYNQAVAIHPNNANIAYFGGALTSARTSDGGSTFYKSTDATGSGLPYVHSDVHAAAFDAANDLYIGSDGGVFKTTNPAGNPPTFTHLNNGLTTHLVNSVGSSPANPSVVIGGMQDNGTRVRVGGSASYNQYIGGDGFGSDVHPTTASKMLASQSYGRILKSTDGGTTWVSACSGITECNNSSTAPFYTRIVPWSGDANGNTVYTFSNTKIYKSTNYAGSWLSVGTSPTDGGSSVLIRNLAVAKTNSNVLGVVGAGGRVFTSTNGGSTWNLSYPPNHGGALSYISFDTTDASIVYVASVAPNANKSHVWKSTNGGVNFTAIDGGGFPLGIPVNAIKTDPTDHLRVFAATHLGIYESSDGGATWVRSRSGMPYVNVSDFYISSDSTLMRAATYGRGFWELQ